MNIPRVNGLAFDNLRGDVAGGLTAAVVALPLALAFGIASGAGALAGLYGAVVLGFFAAIFGGTPAQISGPTGPMTVLMAAVIVQHSDNPAIAFTVAIMAGGFQVLMGGLGIGRYMLLMPTPVVSGFMSGVGCIIIILQLGPLLGQDALSNATEAVVALPGMIQDAKVGALLVGLISLATISLTPRSVARFVPSPLLALLLGTASALALSTEIPTIGEIPAGLPSLVVPAIDAGEFRHMVGSAFALALLGMIDSLLTSLVADTMTQTYHKPDRELVGQGLGNMLAGLFGGIPGAGATMRTVVNIRAGGRTPISGVVHAATILAVVLWFGPLAAHVPLAVLAGILIKVGIDIIDWGYLRRVRRAPKEGVALMTIVLVLTVFVDLIVAVTVGVVLASLLLVKRMTDLQLSGLRAVTGETPGSGLDPEEASIFARADGRIVLFEFRGPFSFGAARGVAARLMEQVSHGILVLDLADVPMIDSSAALALDESIRRATGRGQFVIMTGANSRVVDILRRLDVLTLFPEGFVHEERLQALRHASELLALSTPSSSGPPVRGDARG